jgi:hypothetical protein
MRAPHHGAVKDLQGKSDLDVIQIEVNQTFWIYFHFL